MGHAERGSARHDPIEIAWKPLGRHKRLATAAGIVLFCEDGGIFTAANARTGKRLWQWHAEPVWRSSPYRKSRGAKSFRQRLQVSHSCAVPGDSK